VEDVRKMQWRKTWRMLQKYREQRRVECHKNAVDEAGLHAHETPAGGVELRGESHEETVVDAAAGGVGEVGGRGNVSERGGGDE